MYRQHKHSRVYASTISPTIDKDNKHSSGNYTLGPLLFLCSFIERISSDCTETLGLCVSTRQMTIYKSWCVYYKERKYSYVKWQWRCSADTALESQPLIFALIRIRPHKKIVQLNTTNKIRRWDSAGNYLSDQVGKPRPSNVLRQWLVELVHLLLPIFLVPIINGS